MGAFEEDHEKDMQDPVYAYIFTEITRERTAEELAHEREMECEHLNSDTTYEDEDIWQGMCRDCGGELEYYVDDWTVPVDMNPVPPDDSDW